MSNWLKYALVAGGCYLLFRELKKRGVIGDGGEYAPGPPRPSSPSTGATKTTFWRRVVQTPKEIRQMTSSQKPHTPAGPAKETYAQSQSTPLPTLPVPKIKPVVEKKIWNEIEKVHTSKIAPKAGTYEPGEFNIKGEVSATPKPTPKQYYSEPLYRALHWLMDEVLFPDMNGVLSELLNIKDILLKSESLYKENPDPELHKKILELKIKEKQLEEALSSSSARAMEKASVHVSKIGKHRASSEIYRSPDEEIAIFRDRFNTIMETRALNLIQSDAKTIQEEIKRLKEELARLPAVALEREKRFLSDTERVLRMEAENCSESLRRAADDYKDARLDVEIAERTVAESNGVNSWHAENELLLARRRLLDSEYWLVGIPKKFLKSTNSSIDEAASSIGPKGIESMQNLRSAIAASHGIPVSLPNRDQKEIEEERRQIERLYEMRTATKMPY